MLVVSISNHFLVLLLIYLRLNFIFSIIFYAPGTEHVTCILFRLPVVFCFASILL